MSEFIECHESNFRQVRFLQEFLSGHNGFICGGCFKNLFTGERAKDLDVFFRNEQDFLDAVIEFDGNDSEYIPFYKNKKVKAFKHRKSGVVVELIRKIFGSPQEILEQFDFTIAKFAYFRKEVEDEPSGTQEEITLFDNESLTHYEYCCLYHEKFFEHLTLKRLVVDDKLPFPASTFERIIKYAKYGFFPCKETKVRIIEGIRGLPEGQASISESLYDGVD